MMASEGIDVLYHCLNSWNLQLPKFHLVFKRD
nr:MAG TPA: hypothetical protein [Caudoviricetes sp.]